MFNKPILFYSDYCVHSTNFINVLMKHEELFNYFIRVNIDVDSKTKKRPDIFYTVQKTLQFKITEVPTIIVENGEYILSGKEAFSWLEAQLNDVEKMEDLSGFNPIEMGSFSDSYSSYGNNSMHDNAKQQSFKFIGEPDLKINTPQETSEHVSSEEYNQKIKQRESNFTNKGNSSMFTEQMNINSGQKMNLDRSMFTNVCGRDNNGLSKKQKDLDMRYQQMLAERERM